MRKFLEALACWTSLLVIGGGAVQGELLSSAELETGYEASSENSAEDPLQLIEAAPQGLTRLSDLAVLEPYVRAHTLVVFDIDDTLISDEETTDINVINEHTAQILYLTSRRAKHAERTRHKLGKHGLLLSKRWLPRDLWPFQIISTSRGRRLAHKGPYLLASVNAMLEAGVKISNIIFVDDRPSQVRSVVDSFASHSTPCLGVIFDRYVSRDAQDKKRDRSGGGRPPEDSGEKAVEEEGGIIISEEAPVMGALSPGHLSEGSKICGNIAASGC